MQGVFPIGARFFYALRKKEIGYETKNLDSIPDSALGAMYRFGLAACGSFGGDPDESGDNGDDTTIVTPGDPDDNPVPPPEEDDPVAPPEEDDPVTPHEHTYTSEVTRELSCDQEGERIYTCTCGDSYTEPVIRAQQWKCISLLPIKGYPSQVLAKGYFGGVAVL